MKPARLVETSGIPSSSLILIHSLSGLNTTCGETSSILSLSFLSSLFGDSCIKTSLRHYSTSKLRGTDSKYSTGTEYK
ncbi:hypothetical protein YC2023_058091 [Brassica napus]